MKYFKSSKLGIVANNQNNSGKVVINGKTVGVRPTYLKRGIRKLRPVCVTVENVPNVAVFQESTVGQIADKAQIINKIGAIIKSNEGALISAPNRNNLEQLFASLDKRAIYKRR